MAEFNIENLIDSVQNEPVSFDVSLNASEEENELAWKRIADYFGISHG
jgi:hypothetical protein